VCVRSCVQAGQKQLVEVPVERKVEVRVPVDRIVEKVAFPSPPPPLSISISSLSLSSSVAASSLPRSSSHRISLCLERGVRESAIEIESARQRE
jgi:hypothetical protein